MKQIIDPGRVRRTVNFLDHIVFSHVKDCSGDPLELQLSLMVQNGNAEMRLASGRDDEASFGLQPVLLWINGAGWRGCDRNIMACELEYFAERGFAVCCIDYRSSAQGHWPDQLVDCKTAVRFLRAHAAQYGLDPGRIAAFGRSAGGHLASWMALNKGGFDSDEWSGYSSEVSCAVDFFGPADLTALNLLELERMKDPSHRWHRLEDTHGGALLGGDPATMLERSPAASPVNFIHPGMAPLMILHGDRDPLVPLSVSEAFYEKLCAAGLEEQTEFYVVKNGGHGTRELFQDSMKALLVRFFRKYLK